MDQSLNSLLLFLGGILLGGGGVFYALKRKKYITYYEALELAEEIEQCTLEQVLETLNLVEEQKIINNRIPHGYR